MGLLGRRGARRSPACMTMNGSERGKPGAEDLGDRDRGAWPHPSLDAPTIMEVGPVGTPRVTGMGRRAAPFRLSWGGAGWGGLFAAPTRAPSEADDGGPDPTTRAVPTGP